MAHHGRHVFLLALTLAAGCGSVVTFSKVSRDKGIEQLAAGQYAEAEGAFADAIRQNPRDYQSHTYLGILYDRQKQYTNALAHFKTSLDVQPLSEAGAKDPDFRVKTLTAQADTWAKVPDNDRSVNDLTAKAAASTTGEEAFQLARIFSGRGDADSAVAAYNQAAQQAPYKFYIVKAQGLYFIRQGLKAPAEQALRQAYRINDQDAEVNAGLRSLGIIPGPSLKDPTQLQKPMLPTGPLPDWINRNRAPSQVPAGDVPPDVQQ
ncbi:MAG: Domain containing protein [Phycisphaerales bacterium]|nr:Domain containing protein [Phycisphaerales bacterium]